MRDGVCHRRSGFSRRCLFLLWFGCFGHVSFAQETTLDFDRVVAPILVDHCLDCHSGEEPKGGLDLAVADSALSGGDSGAAIVPGDLDASGLWQRVDSGEMPPKQSLSISERQTLRDWITRGATWGTSPIDPFRVTTKNRAGSDWWALLPITRGVVPTVTNVDPSRPVRNPIDAFVQQRLQQSGLTPSAEASPRVLIRRLTFDLLGLPPAPEDVLRFENAVRTDGDAALNELVDQLLGSRHFGERWARHWLDVVRFGESQGFERDKLRDDSWYYRDWVIHALNEDMPYDEFVRQQIAGDILYPDDANAITATGFLVAGPWDEVGQSQRSVVMKAVVRQDEIEDYVGTIGQTFLGLTVNCARCHDHKFDPIRQKEYYQLAAAVGGVHHGSRNVSPPEGNKRTSQIDTPIQSAPDGGDKIELVAANRLLQKAHSVYAVKPSTAETAYVLDRGNPANRGEQVTAGGVAAIAGLDSDFKLAADSSDADRRRKLAEWITDRRNPLFARVIVNRLWHYHFGSGLVPTPNDFGFNGGRPSHPHLLDWLAAELIDSGWSLKHVHRLIVTSATYRQSSRFRGDCGSVDADNRLLWRKSPMRLEAEALRDSILSVSGQLNRQYGGPPYRDFTTAVNNSQFYTMTDPDDPDVYRRTVYRTWIRSGRNHLLDAFDCPDPSTTAPQRAVTTTPIQALALMNNSFVLRMSDRFAQRVSNEVGNDPRSQADRVCQLAYGRSPSGSESERLGRFVSEQGLSALCRVVLNSNEFIHVD